MTVLRGALYDDCSRGSPVAKLLERKCSIIRFLFAAVCLMAFVVTRAPCGAADVGDDELMRSGCVSRHAREGDEMEVRTLRCMMIARCVDGYGRIYYAGKRGRFMQLPRHAL